jgi:hypothetical protein
MYDGIYICYSGGNSRIIPLGTKPVCEKRLLTIAPLEPVVKKQPKSKAKSKKATKVVQEPGNFNDSHSSSKDREAICISSDDE